MTMSLFMAIISRTSYRPTKVIIETVSICVHDVHYDLSYSPGYAVYTLHINHKLQQARTDEKTAMRGKNR